MGAFFNAIGKVSDYIKKPMMTEDQERQSAMDVVADLLGHVDFECTKPTVSKVTVFCRGIKADGFKASFRIPKDEQSGVVAGYDTIDEHYFVGVYLKVKAHSNVFAFYQLAADKFDMKDDEWMYREQTFPFETKKQAVIAIAAALSEKRWGMR